MSMDSADDLEGAEDLADLLAEALRPMIEWSRLAEMYGHNTSEQIVDMKAAKRMLAQFDSYCRATCDPNADPEGCTDEYCGCPCHSRVEVEA